MEKDQLDSLATVAVGSEKIPPPPHSHYAPSEVYSSSESPPAYSRPGGRSTSVQIARIIATTLIAISVIIGSFILAAAWLQARASCTPENIAAMQAQMGIYQQQEELFKRLQPEALVQDPIEAKESLQSLAESATTKQPSSDIKDKNEKTDDDNSKADNESSDSNEDDYDDSELPPVHIKLPLQLDLDDLAGTLMQQARSLVSCVVERRRSDEFMNGEDNNNGTDNRGQRLNGERVTILCESGNQRRPEQQDDDILTPIIVPLGQVQMQPQEENYHRYQVPEMQRPPLINIRPMNPMEQGMIPPIVRNIAQMMGASLENQRPMEIPIEMRQLPIEIIRGMKPPMDQEQHQQRQPMYPQDQSPPVPYNHEQQYTQGMMPPPPTPQNQARVVPQMIIRQQIEPRPSQSEESSEKGPFPFPGLPLEIRRIIQQVPMEIKNIIQHITGERPASPVPEGARREQVQDFKPFPDNTRPVQMEPLMLPVEIRNLLEQGSLENQQNDNYEGQLEQVKVNGENQHQDKNEDEEKKFPVPPEVRTFIHQVIEGRAIPVPRFPMPMRPAVESLEVPVESSARVMDDQEEKEQTSSQQEQQQAADEANRPHYVQPRSVRSIPDALVHPRDKRVRRCACDCAC